MSQFILNPSNVDDIVNDALDAEVRAYGGSYPASVDVREVVNDVAKVNVIRADNSEASYTYDASTSTLTCVWDSEDEQEELFTLVGVLVYDEDLDSLN